MLVLGDCDLTEGARRFVVGVKKNIHQQLDLFPRVGSSMSKFELLNQPISMLPMFVCETQDLRIQDSGSKDKQDRLFVRW